MSRRIQALAAALADLGLDAYYCRTVSDIRWLTGFAGVFDGENAHLALVTREGMAVHTDGRYSTAMRERAAALDAGDVSEISDEALSHAVYAARALAGGTVGHPAEGGSLRLGIEKNIALSEYRLLTSALAEAGISCELVEVADPVARLREVKDASEAGALRRAQAITDRCFDDLLGWIAPGMTELEVANEMEYRMRGFGASGLAFPSIVASGPHSAMPHAIPSERRIAAGDLVVLDFGARLGDYCSDMTRTIAIGAPSAEARRIYDSVLRAHEECKAMIAPGVRCADVHALAARIIEEAGYGGCFTHGLGHGVGIDVHEGPSLSPRNADGVLEEGNVVTVEPGIYVPGVAGVRIEDYGMVVAAGFDAFTRSPHDLVVI